MADEEFAMEVSWCIEKLESILLSSKAKPESKKAKDAVKALKILTNPKSPFIKKRQAMRNSLGDYRKKMEEATDNSKKQVQVEAVKLSEQKSSKFWKKSSAATTRADIKPETQSNQTATNEKVAAEEIKVNFSADTKEKDLKRKNYVMPASDNSFRFNFSLEES